MTGNARLRCTRLCYATWWNSMSSYFMLCYAVLYFMWRDIIFYVMSVYDMIRYDVLWCDTMCRVRPWCIMSCHDMLQSVMSCYVVLCHVVLCYGQSARTFYMCLESLVGCMKENFDSSTYFSADGTIIRSFAKYFWAEHIIAENWCIFEAMLVLFRNTCWSVVEKIKQFVKQLWRNYEASLKQY